MPRRPTKIEHNVPLFLVPHMMMHAVRKQGEEVEWMEATRMENHFYKVRIRTRPVRREFQSNWTRVQARTKTGGV